MKVPVLFILLATSTVKEKDACHRSRDKSNSIPRAPINLEPLPTELATDTAFGQPLDETVHQSITSSDAELRARLFEIPEDERHWRKDHEILLGEDTAQLSAWTILHEDVIKLRNILGYEDPFTDPVSPSKDKRNPFLDQPASPSGDMAKNPLLDTDSECEVVTTYGDEYKRRTGKELSTKNSWDVFFATISNCHMYPENSDEKIQDLLNEMFKLEIDSVENFGGGNNTGAQLKLKLKFTNGKYALFKPMK